MKITEKKTETVTRDVGKDVVCNLCGESCIDPTGPNNLGCEVSIQGCYGSAFPPDMVIWRFDLCELCIAFLASRSKIFPDVEDGMGMSDQEKNKSLIVDGKTDGYHDWVIARYAAAMSRAALFASAENIAAVAAGAAGRALDEQIKKSYEEAHAMHAALDKIAAPRSNDSVLDRVTSLAGSTDDRLVALVRRLHDIVADHFSGLDVDKRKEAIAIDDAGAFLDSQEDSHK